MRSENVANARDGIHDAGGGGGPAPHIPYPLLMASRSLRYIARTLLKFPLGSQT